MDKYPLTIRLDEQLLKVVKTQAAQTRSSLGSVVVDAARQALMPEYREEKEQVLLRAMDRCFNKLVKLHEDQQSEHELMQEMLAMFVRTFLRHTPAVKPDRKDEAWASAARRFEVFLKMLATNRSNRESVMDPPPEQDGTVSPPRPERPAKTPQAEQLADPGSLFGAF